MADNNPPSVKSHPLAQTKDIPSKIPSKGDGRLPMILDAMKEIKEKVGHDTALYGLFTGPFPLASHLRGQSFFMAMDPEYCKNLLDWLKKWAKRVYRIKGFCSENNKPFYIQAVHDVVTASELSHKPREKFLIVLGPADDEISKTIQSSWSEHFQTKLTLA